MIVLINKPVALTSRARTLLGGTGSVRFVIHSLVLLPVTELVLPLDPDLLHDWFEKNALSLECG